MNIKTEKQLAAHLRKNPLTKEEIDMLNMLDELPQADLNVPQDYQVRRTRIRKGDFAPQGFIWMIVIVNVPKIYGVTVGLKSGAPKPVRYEAFKLIPANMGPEFEKGAADGLRMHIDKTYNY